MKFLIVLAAILAVSLSERTSYKGYTVFSVVPKTEADVSLLKVLENSEHVFDFWSPIRSINNAVDVMVSPIAKEDFVNLMNSNGLEYSVKIVDVESAFEVERYTQTFSPRASKITFNKYERYDDIMDYVKSVSKASKFATTSALGKTSQGRDIPLVKISSGGNNKPIILVDCGIHAREWMSPAVCLYIINQLTENDQNQDMFENVDWYIVPVLNPDGYEYTHTNDRLWRKTRKPGKTCAGADANRNFDFHWMEIGASDYECSETFAGKEAFSESETRALRDFMLANKDRIKLYLTFHSYGQYLLYPWGYTSALPKDEPELKALGRKVNTAISSYRGTRYTIGTSTNVLYAAAGGSDDYAKGVAGIELSYTIELPGGWWGFDPPATEIKPVVRETWLGVVAYHKYIEEKFA